MSDLGYPMIQARSTNYSQGRQGYSIIWVIVHCTAQAYQDSYPERLGQYWARETTQVSVHYGISDTQAYQYVAHSDTAYQARNPANLRGVGIEFSGLGEYSRATWLGHDRMLRNGGDLVARIASRHGIPLRYTSDDDLRNRRPGITTHAQLTRVFGGTHDDPGTGFPLDVLLNYAQGNTPQPPKEEDDDMGQYLGPLPIPVDQHWTGPINPVLTGAANPRPGWLNVTNDTFDTDYQLRLFLTDGKGGWGPVTQLADPKAATYIGDGVWKFKSGVWASFPLPKGTVSLSISRQPGYKGPLSFGIEYGDVQR